MNKINFLQANKNKWNKKETIKVNNNMFKVVGIGPKALKVLWFGPTPGVSGGTWNQCWWNYENIDNTAKEVINVMYNKLKQEESGQTVLSL